MAEETSNIRGGRQGNRMGGNTQEPRSFGGFSSGGGLRHSFFRHFGRFGGGSTTPPRIGQGFNWPNGHGGGYNGNGPSGYNPDYERPGMQHHETAPGGNNGPGWFDGIIKQFYDPKDGFKISGALGAVAGAMLGMSFLGTGSWLGIIAMGVMTLAGAWAGNKITSSVGSYFGDNATPPPVQSQNPNTPHVAAAQPIVEQGPLTIDIQQQAKNATAGAPVQGDGQNHEQTQVPTQTVPPARKDAPAPQKR